MKKYQVICICNESINNDTLAAYTTKFLDTIHAYDTTGTIDNANLSTDIKAAYQIQGKNMLNVVVFEMMLEHTDKLGAVLKNIARKYHQTKDTFRICILNAKKACEEITDIQKFRKSVEFKIYS